MEGRAFECDLNIEWPPTKREQGQYATGNIQANYNTCDHIVTTFYRVSGFTSSQVESRICNMSSAGARTILRRADACRSLAAQVDLTRGHMVTDIIESFLTTATCRARPLCTESDPDLSQSTRIVESHLQLGPDNTAIVGDLNFSEDSLGKRGTLATTENVDHSSENRVHATYEVFDYNAIEFSRSKICMEDLQREPCEPGPLLGLQPQPRLPGFSVWLPLRHTLPAIERLSMHRRQSPRRESRLTVSPDGWATTTTHLRLILKARALDSTFKPVIIVVVGITVVLWRSERGRAAARRLQRRRFPILPNHDDTEVMRLRPPTARRTSACCEVWVTRFRAGVGVSLSASRRSRLPGAQFRFETVSAHRHSGLPEVLSAVATMGEGSSRRLEVRYANRCRIVLRYWHQITRRPPCQRRPRLVALALNANDWGGVPCDAAPTFLAWGRKFS
ncbi:hypothetical protein MRX96_024307 [Rhipicephalus microplus]|uniref:Uncharacterized protein n=1 Tax=Rhipicephalus microplus TaxID=6941 RepID=A0A9J6D3Y5_RHIMP|nr:hypothetical protein HPB51_005843 [Rhipicephalus microplus]